MSADPRLDALRDWLTRCPPALGVQPAALAPASADASFRRYFRVAASGAPGRTAIAMDAPPPQEDCRPFVHVAALLRAAGLHAPQVLAQDLDAGFLLLTDLGTTTYLDALDARNADALFDAATTALVRWQLATRPALLPDYDEALLRRELALFPDWYLGRHRQFVLDAAQRAAWDETCALLVRSALAQPVVFVHRDYMPRNLMVAAPNPGILDFQDAVCGPLTYDLVSLLRDAFVSWEEGQVLDWTVRAWEKQRAAGLPVAADFAEYYRAFEWMGVQRHLKVLGIFARIQHRDGKPRYLQDAPRFVAYVRAAASRYAALMPLLRLFDALDGAAPRTGLTF